MTYLAGMYYQGKGGLEKDEKRAVELSHKAADLGNPEAMTQLGSFYLHGKDGLARTALQSPPPGAMPTEAALAYLKTSGKTVRQMNEEKAVELFRKAAALGDPQAMVQLAYMYAHGQCGLKKDDEQAAALYRRAADLGEPTAMSYLRSTHKTEKSGTKIDQNNPVECFRKATGVDLEWAKPKVETPKPDHP
jgi:TPR repeat protein